MSSKTACDKEGVEDSVHSVVVKKNYFQLPEKKDVINYTPHLVLEEVDDLLFGETPIICGMIQTVTSSYGSNLEGILTAIETAVRAGCTMVVAPEYSFFPATGPLSEFEYRDYLKKLHAITKGSSALVIPGTLMWKKKGHLHNSTSIFSDGELVYEYHKMRDGGESCIATRFGLIPHYGEAIGLFSWNGLKVGIEVCADYGMLAVNGVRDCDVLFFISCGIYYPAVPCVRKGGYAIVTDGAWMVYDIIKNGATKT